MLVNRAGHPRLAEISSERRQIVRSWWEMLAADPSWKREVYNSPSLSMCCVCSRRYGKPSKRLLDPEQNVAHAMTRGQGISAQIPTPAEVEMPIAVHNRQSAFATQYYNGPPLQCLSRNSHNTCTISRRKRVTSAPDRQVIRAANGGVI